MIIIYNVKVTYSCSKAIAPLFLVSWSPSPLMCEVPWQLVNCLSKFGMLKNLGMRACRKQLFISALLGVIFKVVYAYIGSLYLRVLKVVHILGTTARRRVQNPLNLMVHHTVAIMSFFSNPV